MLAVSWASANTLVRFISEIAYPVNTRLSMYYVCSVMHVLD